MSNSEQYDVNFFRPITAHARANKRLILTLAIIWAVGVFGFQFLLMVLNKPTPEKQFTVFESVWPQVVENESADAVMKQKFARSLLAVLGKNIAVKEDHKHVLKEALSWTIYSMQDDSGKTIFRGEPGPESVDVAAASIGLTSGGMDKVMRDLLPTSLVEVEHEKICENCQKALPEIMELYLVHNQSFLTDFRFLGFPFHYWYTAQFLLIMFVLLCVIYAKVTDRMNIKHDFVEET